MFKKISTLVCATAMAASAFTGVVANAAVERDEGVNLVGTKIADNKIKIDVYAVGGYNTVGAVDLNFSIDGAEVDSVKADYAAISGGLYNVVDSHLVKTTAASVNDVSLENGLILTITFTLKADISEDVTITLADACVVDGLEYYVEDLESDPEYVTLGFNDVLIKGSVVPVDETYDKGYVFTASNDIASKKFTTLKVNVIDKENNNAVGYAEENIADQLATITGPAALTIFIKNIPAAYEVTSVELN